MFRNKTKHCRKCGQAGHNRRTCGNFTLPQPPTATPSIPTLLSSSSALNPHTVSGNNGGAISDAYETIITTLDPLIGEDAEPFDGSHTYGGQYSLNDLEVVWELLDNPTSPLQGTPVEDRESYAYWERFRDMYNNMRDDYRDIVHPKVWVKFLEKISDLQPSSSDNEKLSNFEDLKEGLIGLDISLSYPKIDEQPGEGIFRYLLRSEKLYNKYPCSYASSSNLPESIMEQLKNSNNPRVLAALLQNRGGVPQRITEEIYTRFASDETKPIPGVIFYGILQNGRTSDGKFLQKVWAQVEKEHAAGSLSEQDFTELQAMAVYNNNFPYEEKIIHLNHPDQGVRAALSTQCRYLDSNVEQLLRDDVPRVRESFIWNYQLSAEDKLKVLKILIQDENKSIAAAAQFVYDNMSRVATLFDSNTTI